MNIFLIWTPYDIFIFKFQVRLQVFVRGEIGPTGHPVQLPVEKAVPEGDTGTNLHHGLESDF